MGLGDNTKGLLIDLSGTLYVEDTVVEGALEAIRRCHEAGLKILFVTNTTSRPRRRIIERMERLGFSPKPEEIFTAPIAAATVLKSEGAQRCHFLLNSDVLEDLHGIDPVDESPDAVVVGDIGSEFDYDKLNQAFHYLMEDEAEFYALAANRYFESEKGPCMDVGPFVTALEYATGRKARLVGKPSSEFFQAAVEKLGLETESVAMVGDDIEGDVGGAMDAGLTGILVRTGKYRDSVLKDSGIEPDHVIDSIADLPDLFS